MQQSDTVMGDVTQHDGGLDIPELPDPFLPEEDFTMDPNSTSPISHLTSSLSSNQSSASNEEAYIRSYFSTYHLLYPFVHEASFMWQYREISSVAHHTAWPILSNMVVAMGAWSTGEDSCNMNMIYSERAKNCLKQISVLDKGNVTLLQALLLLSAYNEKRGNPKESWNFLGLAVRMSIGLGLHRESTYTSSSQSLLEKEIQRRVWWSVYCTDSCSSKIHGLPLLLPEDRLIAVRPVLNISDEALTLQTTTHPPETEDLPIYTGLIQQASYHRLANRIYRRLLSVDQISAQEMKSLEDMIDNWHINSSRYSLPFNSKQLPEWAILARDRQLLCDRSLRLLVHRPVLLRLLDKRCISTSIEGVAEDGGLAERQCRVNALHTARTTIKIVANLISEGRFLKTTLSFIL
ncbi:fungal specific transcription factor domain-containing protein [Aspergillus melleus]|uniref:fungal specific transcription factor domain-containing protein n=1 Tax=Aspergillus melleus TaxID=138277 RepID=UPI001E8EBB8B|nr:uncharacterized protein LDX57_009286 [Aspergillus melleus]KAH8431629.1 hypothetical protein LDX57_009286 [Aspergillus melleus]